MLLRGLFLDALLPASTATFLVSVSASGVGVLQKTPMLVLLALPFLLAFMITEAEIRSAVHVTNRNRLTVMVGVGITLIREEKVWLCLSP